MKILSRSALLTLSLLLLSACAAISPEIEEYARANTDRVRLEFRHFPLPQHGNAFRAAVASECANLQGKFWEYATLNYQNQNNLSEDKLKEMAQTLSLDTASFDACLDSNQTAGRVRDDLSSGQVLGIRFTPSIYVNGKLIQYTTKEAFEGYIDSLK